MAAFAANECCTSQVRRQTYPPKKSKLAGAIGVYDSDDPVLVDRLAERALYLNTIPNLTYAEARADLYATCIANSGVDPDVEAECRKMARREAAICCAAPHSPPESVAEEDALREKIEWALDADSDRTRRQMVDDGVRLARSTKITQGRAEAELFRQCMRSQEE
jgi:hypothetical protein